MRMRRFAVLVIFAGALSATPGVVGAQTAVDPYYEFLNARRLAARGDVPGALAALQRAATADPRSASIRAEVSSLYFDNNRRTEAEEAAQAALALDANNALANRVLGFIYTAKVDAQQGRGAQAQTESAANVRLAVGYLERASASPSMATDINLFMTLGRLYLRAGDPGKAVPMLTRVVGLNPNYLQGRLTLSQAQLVAGKLDDAIETLQVIVEDEPRVAATLGQYLERAGRSKEAADAFTLALQVAPTNVELKFRRAAALFAARDFAAANEAAAAAQQEHPDDLRFPRLRARALVETGAPARAVAVLEPVARANPTDNGIQFALADLYNDTGRFPDAERTLRQVVSREPANANALNYLGYLLADHGQQLDEAIRLVKRALELEPENPSYQDSLGWAYFRQGNAAEAQKHLGPAADKLPKNSVIQDHLGDVYARLGRWQEAVAAWTRALDGDGDSIDRDAIQKKLMDARPRAR